MVKIDKCPECGSRYIGKGVLTGSAAMTVKGRPFTSSKVVALVCSNCGLIFEMRVDKPEKFVPKEF